MIVTLTEVVVDAKKNGYAIPAFSTFYPEDIRVMMDVCEELESPLIMLVPNLSIPHYGSDAIASICRDIAKKSKVPVVVHLDHGSDLDMVFHAIRSGFSSVMYDGSSLPLEENIRNTEHVMKVAKSFGIDVEGEVGCLAVAAGSHEEGKENILYTDPNEAKQYFEATEVDALAVSIGNVHGMQTQKAEIQHDIAEEIGNLVSCPLVLHGSSGIPDEDIVKLVKGSFCKVNIGMRLLMAFKEGLADSITDTSMIPYDYMSKAADNIRSVYKEKIRLMGSAQKA